MLPAQQKKPHNYIYTPTHTLNAMQPAARQVALIRATRCANGGGGGRANGCGLCAGSCRGRLGHDAGRAWQATQDKRVVYVALRSVSRERLEWMR